MKTKTFASCCRSALLCLLSLFLFSAASPARAQVIIPLTIVCPPNLDLWTCSSNIVWQYEPPTVLGGCERAQVFCDPPSGSTFPLGITTVTCRVIDSCQRVDSCSFTVTVRRDIEPPKIECPPDRTLLACPTPTGLCGTVVNYPTPVASDNSGSVAVQCFPPSGSLFTCGDTVVTCVAEDRCGNRAGCRFTVTVKEGGFPPGIQCPSDRVINTCSNTAVLNYPLPVVNPAGTDIQCNPPPGTVLPLGIHTVVCVAANDCGTNRCSFNVAIRPIAPVDIQCPSTQTLVYTIPCASNCVPVVYPAPTVFNGALESCIPAPGTCLPEGVHVVICRATNQCGAALCEFPVRVVKSQAQPPQIRCPEDITVTICSNAANGTVVNYPAPGVIPAGTSVICNPPSGGFFPIGDTTVTCVASNECGRAACQFKVSVRRVPSVSLVCPNDMVVTTCSNTATVLYPAPVVLPTGTAVICNPPSGSTFAAGDTIVNCVASNECSRAECKFTVTVRRMPPPVIRCPTNDLVFTIPCGSNCVPVVYPPPTVLNGALESCFPPSGTCLPEGIHVVICRATNECGAALCEFPVRVIKGQGEPPIIRCPQDLTLVTCSNCVPLTFPRPEVLNGTLVACNPPAGACLPVGVHTVTCVATNDCGVSRCQFRVKVVTADERPRLSIAPDGRYVVVCWTKTCRCFKLQGARHLNHPIPWVDITDEPVDLGDRYCVRIPISLRMQFFRLISCDQPTAMVYDVAGLPVNREAANKLVEVLGLSPNQVLFGDGSVRFLNPDKFQAIPTRPITDPAILEELRKGTEGDRGELAFEGIDFDGLRGLRVPDADEAIDRFAGALRAADLLPANGRMAPRHTLLEITDDKGQSDLPAVQLDTRVDFQFDLGGIPLIGPGAKLNISFGPGGEPTSLLGSFREHKPFREVPILSLDEATRRCKRLYPALDAKISPRLVYVAPSLLLPAVQKIVPCFACTGEAGVGSETVNLLQSLIPATDDPAFTPTAELDASAAGLLVNAHVVVAGGTPPYAYQWSSSSVDLGGMFPPGASSIEYNAVPRDASRLETVRVVVTDANGVQVQASRTVTLGPGAAGGLGGLFSPAVAGVADFGVERAVSDLCASQQSAFNARLMSAGYTRQFNFSGLSAWERDFKEGGTGLDHVYTDNADMTFYMGHGYGGGFTFEGSHDDGTLHYTDAVKAWGDKDMEWLALLSCSVMANTYDGKSCVQRWGPTFDGLHMMLGFANTAYDSDGFAGTFADWMLGRFGFLPPMPVRTSWLLATDSNQPSSVIASVMGVIGPGGCSNYNDYFHGRGPVGPDIRGSSILGYWRITY